MSEPRYTIIRQFIKDMSFELFIGSKIFSSNWQPQISVDLAVDHEALENDTYEVELVVTVEVRLDEKPAFLIEVKQAGLFEIGGIDAEALQQALGITCPTFLFPYAREAVDSIATRAGMLPIGLQPVNFEEMYQTAVDG